MIDDYFDDGIIERREADRESRYCGALIRFPGGIVSCVVREVSDRGASIRLHSSALLPLEFQFSDDNFQSAKLCRLVWRDGDFLGFEFFRDP